MSLWLPKPRKILTPRPRVCRRCGLPRRAPPPLERLAERGRRFNFAAPAFICCGCCTDEVIRPASDVSVNKWTTSALWSKVDEASADDSDFIQLIALDGYSTTNRTCRFTLTNPATNPNSQAVITIRGLQNLTSAPTADLYQGATLKGSYNPGFGNTFGDTSSSAISSITAPDDLELEFIGGAWVASSSDIYDADGDVSTGSFVARDQFNVPTGGTLWQTLPTSSSDHAYSAVASSFEVSLANPLTDPPRGRVTISATSADGGGGTPTITLALKQGATIKASTTGSGNVSYTLTAAEVESITDWTDLRYLISTSVTGGIKVESADLITQKAVVTKLSQIYVTLPCP